MKIAMIGHKRIPGREGGIEVVVEELATRMAAKGHEVVAYNRSRKNVNLPKIYKGVRLISVPTIEKKSMDAVVYAFLASVRAVFGHYDVIHFHAIGPSFFVFIPYMFRIRTVVTVHGLNYKTPKWKGFAKKFIMAGEKNAAKFADEIIVLSKNQQEYFKKKYGRNSVLIPNGTKIYPKLAPNIIKEEYGLNGKDYILFVSRVVPGKGIEYLLDAYRNIDSNLPLIIAGDSSYVGEFRTKLEEKVARDPRVKMIGFVKGDELRELYSNAKLFVFPSEAEGMPMCLLEALSFDCQCLVSDIPENVEVCGKYADYFKSKDTEDLQRKLKKCLEEGAGEPGSREYIKERYQWDVVVDETLRCYRKNDHA